VKQKFPPHVQRCFFLLTKKKYIIEKKNKKTTTKNMQVFFEKMEVFFSLRSLIILHPYVWNKNCISQNF